jgi:hypothetical protein
MLYGICGAHRSGKTTLAKAVADQLGIDFLDASVSSATKGRFDPVAPMTLRERLEMQVDVFERHLELILQAGRPAIVDRTPLDFYAYLLAEFHMTSDRFAEQDVLEAAAFLAEQYLEAVKINYDMIFFAEILPVYEVDTSKATPPENRAFQLHIDALMRGGLSHIHDDMNYAFVPAMALEPRVQQVADLIEERMNDIDDMRKQVGFH